MDKRTRLTEKGEQVWKPTNKVRARIGGETRVDRCHRALPFRRPDGAAVTGLHQDRNRTHPTRRKVAVEELVTLPSLHGWRKITRTHVPGLEAQCRHNEHTEQDQGANEISPRPRHSLPRPPGPQSAGAARCPR